MQIYLISLVTCS